LPIIDISPLLQLHASPDVVSAVDDAMARACTDVGFFYIVGHGIPAELQSELQSASAQFFSLDATVKQKVAMAAGGKAWRGGARCMLALLCPDLTAIDIAGWFPLGDELTSGRPDQKEGFYMGSEDGDSPLPLHVRTLALACNFATRFSPMDSRRISWRSCVGVSC
jgi:isopenicillin N synthase-like dioxygenase